MFVRKRNWQLSRAGSCPVSLLERKKVSSFPTANVKNLYHSSLESLILCLLRCKQASSESSLVAQTLSCLRSLFSNSLCPFQTKARRVSLIVYLSIITSLVIHRNTVSLLKLVEHISRTRSFELVSQFKWTSFNLSRHSSLI